MTEGFIHKSVAEPEDMQKINRFSRRELSPDEVYTFNVTLCNNDVDRDFEKFSTETLYKMAELFVGKTGISDHSMKSSDQKARIYDAYVEKQEGCLTKDGEQMYCLRAKAYMLNNDENKTLIDEIDAGIKKEVSVSCSMKASTCSICGKDRRREKCEHIGGRSYKGKLCYSILSDVSDAYEFSFVAVPAQREAGVTKAFSAGEVTQAEEVIKTLEGCCGSVMISKAEAGELMEYIDKLRDEARLGEEYKKQLSAEVSAMLAKSFPNVDSQIFSSVTAVMTTKELLGFRNGMKMSAPPKPQLASAEKQNKNNYSQFRI